MVCKTITAGELSILVQPLRDIGEEMNFSSKDAVAVVCNYTTYVYISRNVHIRLRSRVRKVTLEM